MSSPLLHLLGIPQLGSVGPIYIGVTLGMMLYGLTLHQAYRYYKHYPEDPLLYPKGLVTIILLLETLHTIVWMYIGYRYMVIEAFNFPDILNSHWTIPSTFLITSLSVFACQVFYCCRVYNFGAFFYKWILIPAVVPMCVAVTFGIVAGVEAFRIVKVLTDLDKISWMVSVAYGLSAGSDIVLSSILIFALLRVRSQSKIRSTKTVLKTLIIYTINTGLLTSIVSFFAFLFAIVNRQTLVYAGISIVGAKLYANSVLALLNSRRYLNNRLQDDFTSVSLMASDTSGSGSSGAASPPRPRMRQASPRAGRPREETSTIVWAVHQRSTFMSQVSVGDGPAAHITSSAIPEESERGSTPAEVEGCADASEAV
ncbi:hypothetical protein GY45DRAFT_1331264 [Cubamyces sp. BRFM 1775]|nr:hypothetical protein GY45DRAFT_1331264 [Cubamyces sp. BRFM 1775]